MRLPFEIGFDELKDDTDAGVDAVVGSLEAEFMVMPQGEGFVEFATFEYGYEALKRATRGFRDMSPDNVRAAVRKAPMALLVVRCIMGLSTPEWADYASRHTGVAIPERIARIIDRNIRMNPETIPFGTGVLTEKRIRALIAAACLLLESGVPDTPPGNVHRFDKADTRHGLAGLRSIADLGVPYSMLLYERFLGRPFASHRDSVSELVGDVVASAIEDVLTGAGISFRKTGRAECIPGFDHRPDYIVPSEFNPQVVIEAVVTEDEGTAREKVAHIQNLSALSCRDRPPDRPSFELVACIAGRGFGVRPAEMRRLLLATRGKVFTLQHMRHLVKHTRLREFRSR